MFNCVQELMRCARVPLIDIVKAGPFPGPGVYALFYNGPSPLYARLQETNDVREWYPIYVGKAIPRGGRKGREPLKPPRPRPRPRSGLVYDRYIDEQMKNPIFAAEYARWGLK